MKTVFHTILQQLRHNEPVALATVVARKGSLPMSTHAKMAVFSDGSIAGTIGGGALEANVIQAAMQGMAVKTATLLSFELTAEQVESDGLTCGGAVEIFLEYFESSSLPFIETLTTVYAQEQSTVVVTVLPGTAKTATSAALHGQRLLFHENGPSTGTTGDPALDVDIARFARSYLGKDALGRHAVPCEDGDAVQLFFETIVPRPTVYLFGGGHISYQLARLLPMLDFDFVVVDDRAAFANQQRFPEASACVVHDFADISSVVTSDAHSAYAIIVTRGHQSDFEVLQQALRLQFVYIGMIGSRRKINILFEKLRCQGVSQETLATIHAPIGLNIGADTPEEIAVSIAAELIQIRRRKSNNP